MIISFRPAATLLLLALFLSFADTSRGAAGHSGGGAAKRKNVLLLISDDLNTSLGCYGDPLARTPNIDALASRGIRFDRAYANYPLCGPSRNSLLTGLYPATTGVLANSVLFRQTIPEHISLPQAFRLAGYVTARTGKVYHYAVPGSVGTNGLDDPASWEISTNPVGVDRLEEEPHMFTLVPGSLGNTLSWYASPNSDEKHTDAMMARDAVWLLEHFARNEERPFFLSVGFFRPHTPFAAPEDPYFGYHSLDEIQLVDGVEEDWADIPAPALATRRPEEKGLTDELRRKAIQAYHASVSFMDAQVGRVVEALDRLGLADDTIIVFISDHGHHLGEHGLWRKMSLFEESAHVPLLMVAPGRTSGGTVAKAPVSLVDLYPTLAELTGVEAPSSLQGQSLVPMFERPDTVGRGWALTQVLRGGGTVRHLNHSLRTARWRYTEWGQGGGNGRELYDHDNDPHELVNLATSPAYAANVKEMSELLRSAVAGSLPRSGTEPAASPKQWDPVIRP